MVSRANFVDDWAASLERSLATLFIGAGISMAAGYPSWHKLLAKVAKDLELDIDQEHDLSAVAQYYVNKFKRPGLTKALAPRFRASGAEVPPVLRVVARLPLRHVWTTNWDPLIETAFRNNRREPHVIVQTGDLALERPDTDVAVYKMHGSAEHLDAVVLTTDDFELYRVEREAFLRVLASDLISTSFLFLGISFTDPNLGHVLAEIREMYERYASADKLGKIHYAIVKRPHAADFSGQDGARGKLKIAEARHELFVQDLTRYHIHCVEIDQYSEIEEVLAEVEQRIAQRSVFVSGSLADGALAAPQADRVRTIAREVGRAIAASGKRLISGYGLGIGDHVLSGMVSELPPDSASKLATRLSIRPFPRSLPEGTDENAFKALYREDLVAPAGTCIVICGLRRKKDGSGGFELGPGVREEVEIARRLKRLLIPIGATHGIARQLWQEMNEGLAALDPRISRAEFATLGDDSADASTIGKAVVAILTAGDRSD